MKDKNQRARQLVEQWTKGRYARVLEETSADAALACMVYRDMLQVLPRHDGEPRVCVAFLAALDAHMTESASTGGLPPES